MSKEPEVNMKWIVALSLLVVGSTLSSMGAEGEVPAAAPAAAATPKEKLVLVQVTDAAKETSFQVLTDEEFKTLKADISLEARLLPKAIAAARRDWESSEDTRKKAFPANAASPRQLKVIADFTDRKAAEARQSKLEEQEADRAQAKKDREDGKAMRQKKPADNPFGKVKSKVKVKEKDTTVEQARQMIENKLAELKEKEKEGAKPPAGKEEKAQ